MFIFVAKSKTDDDRSRSSRKSRRSEERRTRRSEDRRSRRSEERRVKRSEDRRKRSEERRSRRSEERRSRRSEEKRSKRSEEIRSKRSEEGRTRREDRYDRSPSNYQREPYYSPYRNRSLSPLPRGPRTPPNTPPPNSSEFEDYRGAPRQYNNHIDPMYQDAPRFNANYHNSSINSSNDGKSPAHLFHQVSQTVNSFEFQHFNGITFYVFIRCKVHILICHQTYRTI